MRTINQIFIANSVYAFFLYCMKFIKEVDNTLFVLGPSCAFADVAHFLPVVAPDDKKDLDAYKDLIKRQVFFILSGRKVPCYGNVETIYSQFFIETFDFYPMTDGLRDTVTFPMYLKNNLFRKCYTVRYPGGLDLTHPLLEYMDINQLWGNLTVDEKNKIARIFQLEKTAFIDLESKKKILITQPLFEDGICSLEDKIKIYKQILSNYDLNEIVIKPHPRECTNWKEIFPQASVMPHHIPSEVIPMIIPDLDKVITFFSTAAFNMLKPEQVDFYAKDFKQLRYYKTAPYKDNGVQYKPIASFDVEEKYNVYAFNWKKIPDDDGYFYPKG